MQTGWSKSADHFERNRYGVSRRSFFVPGTECQALCRGASAPAPSCSDGERPQSASRSDGVPGTASIECLAPASPRKGRA